MSSPTHHPNGWVRYDPDENYPERPTRVELRGEERFAISGKRRWAGKLAGIGRVSEEWYITSAHLDPIGPYSNLDDARAALLTLASYRVHQLTDKPGWGVCNGYDVATEPFDTKEEAEAAVMMIIRLKGINLAGNL